MEAEPELGRLFGAWSAMTNLCEKKSYFERGRVGREHSFAPTVSGKMFLFLLFRRLPNFDCLAKTTDDSSDEESDEDGDFVSVPATDAWSSRWKDQRSGRVVAR